MSHSYAAFKLSDACKEQLLQAFPPQFPDVKMDHITIQFPCDNSSTLFEPDRIQVIGYSSDNGGIEALLVEIDDEIFRSDGIPWHITISINKNKKAPLELDPYHGAPMNNDAKDKRKERPYAPVMSNVLLRHALNPEIEDYQIKYLEKPIAIEAKPMLLSLSSSEPPKRLHYEPSAHCPE